MYHTKILEIARPDVSMPRFLSLDVNFAVWKKYTTAMAGSSAFQTATDDVVSEFAHNA